MARLGVAAAVVDGTLLAGDLDVGDDGRVLAVGLDGDGTGTAVPGLVDLQVNGFRGVEFRIAGPDGYARAAAALAAHGATAVQPTFFSCTVEAYAAALSVLAEVQRRPPAGCRFLAAHLEGPFLAPEWRGAHASETFREPDPVVIDHLLRAGPVGFMTVAPERAGGLEAVRRLVAAGVTVSVGHSDATAGQARAAFDAGARHLTHCWNAHRRFAPRDPGPAGAALVDPRVTVGLIADLVHVSPEVLRLTLAAAPGRVAATTDAVPPAGIDPTEWQEHGRVVTVQDGAARLADGTLAGSVAAPDDLVRNLVGVGVSLAEAADACGGAQRRLLGLDQVLLRPGDPADLVVLDDELRPRRTMVAGVEVWAA